MAKKLDLSQLPQGIIKKNRQWFINTATGKWIHTSNIAKYLPKEPASHELIISKRFDLKY